MQLPVLCSDLVVLISQFVLDVQDHRLQNVELINNLVFEGRETFIQLA